MNSTELIAGYKPARSKLGAPAHVIKGSVK